MPFKMFSQAGLLKKTEAHVHQGLQGCGWEPDKQGVISSVPLACLSGSNAPSFSHRGQQTVGRRCGQ